MTTELTKAPQEVTSAHITWDAEGRRILNGRLAPEHATMSDCDRVCWVADGMEAIGTVVRRHANDPDMVLVEIVSGRHWVQISRVHPMETKHATPEPVGEPALWVLPLYTRPAPGVPEGVQWFTVAEHGMPDFDEEVIAGLWYTDPWLKPDRATRFIWGLCRVLKDDHRDFKDGKRWHTFGPSHNDITHWARLNMPALAAAHAKGGQHA